MKKTGITASIALVLCLPVLQAQTSAKSLNIYFIDTEGGHATLYVSPTGESMLVDTGFPGERDSDRIMAAINDAGLKQLDYLLLTHYHVDHVGGVEALAKRIPIRHFVDHGPTVEPKEQVTGFQAMYAGLIEKAGAGSHQVVKPGDRIPLGGLNVEVVTSAGEILKKPMPGAGKPNPECAAFQKQAENRDPENAQSVGFVMAYGKFRTVNLGDFVYNKDVELMCPNNPIGTVDLYLTPNHGSDQSGSAVLVHGLRPTVAIMNNGNRKGGSPKGFEVLHTSPGLEDLWQLHYSNTGGPENNTSGVFIANIEDPSAPPAPPPGGRGRGGGHVGPAFWIKVSAQADGSFTVLNSRNGFSKTYTRERNK